MKGPQEPERLARIIGILFREIHSIFFNII